MSAGGAVGWFIASTSLGYACSLAVSGVLIALGGYKFAFLGTGILPSAGALILWITLRRTPNVVHDLSAGISLTAVLKNERNVRSLMAGYAWHCWELLGMWAWTPAFLAASLVFPAALQSSPRNLPPIAWPRCILLAPSPPPDDGPFIGSSGAPGRSDGTGRSGRSSLHDLRLADRRAVADPGRADAIYGFVVIGDSPVLSAAMTEAVAPNRLGSVLAIRSLLGFSAGAVSPVAFGLVLDYLRFGDHAASAWGRPSWSLRSEGSAPPGTHGAFADPERWAASLCGTPFLTATEKSGCCVALHPSSLRRTPRCPHSHKVCRVRQCSRISSRKISPYFSSFAAPTP